MTTIDRVEALEKQQAEVLAILKRLEVGQERLEAGQERLARFMWFATKELLPSSQIDQIKRQVAESFRTDEGKWLSD